MKSAILRCVFVVAAACLAAAAFGLAVEVPPVSPLDFGGDLREAAWYWQLLASASTMGVVLWIVGKIANAVISWRQWREGSVQVRCVRAVEAAVDQVYRTFVRAAKAASDNGKLTETQKDKALNDAVFAAREIARNQGLNLVKEVGIEMIPVIIEQVIQGRKGAKCLPPPLPDLAP